MTEAATDQPIQQLPLRRLARCLDYLRIPLNVEERAGRPGDIPYWGANTIQGYVDEALVSEPVVLVGEDGAPFFDRTRSVAFFVDSPIWPNNHIHVLRTNLGVDGKWLAYALNDVDYALYVGGSTRDKLTQAALMSIRLRVPALEVQRGIASFLDRGTAKIHALIARQEELIVRAEERKKALVARIVWNGLVDIDVSPTGIEAAPEAPGHWVRARNRQLLHERVDLSITGDQEMLSVSHLTGVTPRSEKSVTMFEAASTVGYRLVSPKNLVINTMWAWMGALGVSEHEGIVSPAYGVYTFHQDVDVRYFEYLYRSRPYVAEMTRHSRGIWSSRLRLYPASFIRLGVVVPPRDEQTRIADHLDDRLAKLDDLIAKTRRFIELSKERRAALITAAVTGQIDVRGEVA